MDRNQGARENNLKNIDVKVPRDQLCHHDGRLRLREDLPGV